MNVAIFHYSFADVQEVIFTARLQLHDLLAFRQV